MTVDDGGEFGVEESTAKGDDFNGLDNADVRELTVDVGEDVGVVKVATGDEESSDDHVEGDVNIDRDIELGDDVALIDVDTRSTTDILVSITDNGSDELCSQTRFVRLLTQCLSCVSKTAFSQNYRKRCCTLPAQSERSLSNCLSHGRGARDTLDIPINLHALKHYFRTRHLICIRNLHV